LFIEVALFLLDLKPENILFGGDGHLKLADLGFAKKLNGGKTKSFCGTPSYLAPEVLERKEYGVEIDWWTFGVLIFQLCSGCSPFQESQTSMTFNRILNCAIRWPPEPQKYFTEIAFDVIMGLFELDPIERLTEEEIRQHEWFAGIDFDAMENKKVPPPGKFHKKQVGAPSGPDMGVELSTGEMKESTDNLFLDF
jgi:serine/threonine protein kinase